MRFAHVLIFALALGIAPGCKGRGEEAKERVDKALQGVTSDEQAIGAVAGAMWRKGVDDFQIKVVPQDDGHRLEIVSMRREMTTLLSSAGAMKDYELRQNAKSLWRLFRSIGDRKLKAVVMTIKLPLTGAGGKKEVLTFLRFRCDEAAIRGIPGYGESDPFKTTGMEDVLEDEGNRFVQEVSNKLVIEVDNSKEVVVSK
jgi:hypothetical protein